VAASNEGVKQMQDGKTARVAIVVQRYGEDVIGGAENLARALAERFVADLGWIVEVLTTTAFDYRTWRNEMPAGCSTLNGVRVRRFDSARQRLPAFKPVYGLLYAGIQMAARLHLPQAAMRTLEKVSFWAQGPVCPQLLRHLERASGDFDAIIFVTYLYYPTVFGLPRVADKALLVPTAHDEPAFHFRHVGDLLAKARYILVNSQAERSLVLSRMHGYGGERVRIAGVGVDLPDVVATKEDKPPYLLYLGRIGDAKGVDRLLEWFLGTPGDTRLLLAGRLDEGFTLPDDPRVEFVGFVDKARKTSLIRNALALVNPSRFESLSLVVLEAMAQEVPVLVNAECEVLAHYARDTETVFAFEGKEEFAARLAHLRAQDWASSDNLARLRRSRDWVASRYSWQSILDVFARSVADIRGAAAAA
jgi:glycosyltransferase involved in cell wall biosynthesis